MSPAPRVAVFSGTTRFHADMLALGGRITVVPMPLRDPEDELRAHMQRARVDAVVADAAHDRLARSAAEGLPLAGPGSFDAWGELPQAAAVACLRTSGTTGTARLLDLPADALAAHRRAAIARLACDPESVWLAALPMWHMGGLGLVDRCLHGGGRLVFPHGDAVPAGVTHVSLVPTMLHRLLGTRRPDSLRCVLVGGDRLDPALAEAALAAGWPVHASYGLTEACGQVATAWPSELAAHPGTSGRPLDGVQVRIEVDGGMADAGQDGEVVVDGPTLAVPGPLRTGDLGHLDDDGRLYVTGRADDRITTGGEKVHPERVEAVLRGCPDVADVGVVGVPDPAWGQRVVAYVVPAAPRPDPAAVASAARAFARSRLAPHEVPKEVHLAPALPRTGSGKLRRAVLRQWHQDHTVPT